MLTFYIVRKRKRAVRFRNVSITQSAVQDRRSKQAFLNLGALLLAIAAFERQGNKHKWRGSIESTAGGSTLDPQIAQKGLLPGLQAPLSAV